MSFDSDLSNSSINRNWLFKFSELRALVEPSLCSGSKFPLERYNAAINAINEVNIQYFFLKPWDPPGENLYPALDDLLDDWRASYTPPYEGIRVLGTRWSAKCYDLRDFLARNRVPYQ